MRPVQYLNSIEKKNNKMENKLKKTGVCRFLCYANKNQHGTDLAFNGTLTKLNL